MTTHF